VTRPDSSYSRIYAAVRRVPAGSVATYGQIARLAGLPGRARQVGYALHALSEDDVPWQRVVNARGALSPRSEPEAERLQRALLEAEGIVFDGHGRIDLARFGLQASG
jgi:methylated-DNA-protein-cysteine methyltransferase-like protein